MASKSVTGSNGYHTFTMTVTERSGSASIANNTSVVDYSIVLSPAQTGWDWNFQNSDPFTLTYTINGVSGTCTLRVYDGRSTVTIKTGSQTIAHNADGSKSINWSFSFTSQNYPFVPGSGSSGTQTLALATIPRYPTSSQSLSSKTETTITMKWSSDMVIDVIHYSTNNGSSWTQVSIQNAKSGSYTISGLSANTTYNIKTRVKASASQLSTDSSALSVKTYAYPYANSMPNFKIGNKVTIGVYNPLKRSFTMTLIAADNTTQTSSATYTGTSVSGWNATSTVNFLYASIDDATSGTYKVRIDSTIGASTHQDTKTGGTYSAVKADVLPTAGTLTYADTNTSMTAITGNAQKIVQGKSTVRYTVSGVEAKKSATISSVKVTVNGSTYTLSKSGENYIGGNAAINSGTNVTATVMVTDSRGYTNTTKKTVTMLAYANPTATITLKRESNYYTPTAFKVNASCSNLNSGNSVTIQRRYAQSGGSYNSWTTINNNTSYTLQLDNQYAWNVQVRVTDTAGGTTTYTKVVPRGMPLMYWDTVKQSVGSGKFPTESNIFEASLKVKITGENTTPFLDFYRTDHDTSGRVYLINSENPAVVTGVKASDDDWVYVTRTQSYGFLPYTASGFSLGSNSYPWSRLYVDAVIENGTSLASKYAQKFGSDAEYTSLDDMTITGFYYFTSSYTSVPVSAGGTVLVIRTSATYIHQLAFMNSSSTSSTRKPVIYARYLNATGWSNWSQISL